MIDQLPSQKEALEILRQKGCSKRIINHCAMVSNLSLVIAKRCIKNGIDLDLKTIQIGGLLHDIGRSQTQSIHHPVVGSKIVRELSLPRPIVRIVERHLGGGVSAKEAQKLGWPPGIYVPMTIEEKIVAYADKLIENDQEVHIEKTLTKLEKELGHDHPAVKRVLNLHKEIVDLCGKTAR